MSNLPAVARAIQLLADQITKVFTPPADGFYDGEGDRFDSEGRWIGFAFKDGLFRMTVNDRPESNDDAENERIIQIELAFTHDNLADFIEALALARYEGWSGWGT